VLSGLSPILIEQCFTRTTMLPLDWAVFHPDRDAADGQHMRRWLGVWLFLLTVVGRVPVSEGSHRHACLDGVAQAADRSVIFNTKSHVYHHPGCNAALACTVNCVTMSLSEAVKLGGRPCGRCGG
jgi:hypothetical protein